METWIWGLFLAIVTLVMFFYVLVEKSKNSKLKDELNESKKLIKNLEKLFEEEKRNSCVDSLTGLYNRRYLNENAQKIISIASRFNKPVSFLFIDLDNFKRINDAFGHCKGDEVLRKVSNKIQIISRTTDLCVRLGGDEFFIILPGTDEEGAKEFSHRLEAEIGKIADECGFSSDIEFGASIGIYSHQNGMSFEEIIKKSDFDMYKIKERRKK